MKKTLLSLLLCAALLLGLPGCSAGSGALYGDGVPESTQGKDVTRSKAADNVFSLNYNEDYSLNPILATNHSNQLVCDLVYENMVELDNNFNVVPNVLDEGTPNDTATYWIFTINPGHVFHDGSPVTGNDIRYSLERAVATQDRYRGRFASYQGSGYDEAHFYVTLGIGDTQFVKLLNIPIIKAGSMDEKRPLGSGPYTYNEAGDALIAYEGYEGYRDLPIDTIHLVTYSTADAILENFEDGVIDAVTNDPSSYTNLGYSASNEIRNFNTTNLHYIMFNEEGPIARYRLPAGDGLLLRPGQLCGEPHARQRRGRLPAHAPRLRRLSLRLRLPAELQPRAVQGRARKLRYPRLRRRRDDGVHVRLGAGYRRQLHRLLRLERQVRRRAPLRQ